jgi:hypothetical protein
MGKINSGILGPVSGRIGGVVGARWKGQPYLRSYVVPGASETDLQVAQRARFAYVVASAKFFVGRVFNPYYDKFLSKVSGFNRYVSSNIPKAPAYAAIPNYVVTDGPLYPGSDLEGTYNDGTGTILCTWGTELGIDGANSDVAIAWARNRATNTVYFSANGLRYDGAATIASIAGLTATDFDLGVFFAKMNALLVVKISRNLSAEATAP